MRDDTEGYWSEPGRRSRTRRALLRSAAFAGAGMAAVGMAGCASRPNGGASGGQTAAGGSGAQAAPQPGGTLNVALPYNPPLDPQKVSAAAQAGIGGVYSRLLRFKTGLDPNASSDHDVENDLAISIESPDAVTWTVKLRPDAKFHNLAPVNGHAVQAEDIKATFVRALDPATGNPNRGSLTMMDPSQIQTPDASTVVFKLMYSYSPFRKLLASPSYSWILPREALAGTYDLSKVAIGSGPFTLASVTPDVAYTYRKNPEWFERGGAWVDGVRLAIIPDNAQLLAQFAGGNLDEARIRSADDADTVRRQTPKATVQVSLGGSSSPLYFQLGDPSSPFLDIRVRRAMSMAIDRDAIASAIYGGQAELLVLLPGYVGKWAMKVKDLDQSMGQYYKYDPANAKKLLAAAGVPDLQVKFVYITNGPFSTPSYIKHAETVASMLNAVGVKATLGTNDYNKEFVDAGRGSRQGYFEKDTILFGAIGSNTDADDWLFSYLDSKSTSNQEHLSDATYDDMVAKERATVSEDDRLKQVIAIQSYIADRMYAPSTVGTHQWVAVNPRVQNYQFTQALGWMTETDTKLWLKG
ncbi:MAG TPA: ABC transporter substrate-binding protein [Dehalococcoidia bacterium]|nr:ABC transporter substrate-binding protein [Dehalococcoidia bacterium]